MLPALALVLLAAWTARALEVSAAPRNGVTVEGGGGWRGPAPSFIQRSGAVGGGERSRGPSLGSAPYAPACGRPAHLCLRPSPAPETRAPAGAEGSGEASGPGVRASLEGRESRRRLS